jgi:hypothetical protein
MRVIVLFLGDVVSFGFVFVTTFFFVTAFLLLTPCASAYPEYITACAPYAFMQLIEKASTT